MSESEIQEKKTKLSETLVKLERLKGEVIGELHKVLPSYLENSVSDVIQDNHDLIKSIPNDRLKKLKENITNAIPRTVNDVIARLTSSDDWFKCREDRSYSNEISTSPLWRIVQSIDTPLLPILESEKLNIGSATGNFWRSSRIMPLNWDWLYGGGYTRVGESKLYGLDKEYSETLRDYCVYQDSIIQLEEGKKKRAASERWKTI
jgi:hypothetical protein